MFLRLGLGLSRGGRRNAAPTDISLSASTVDEDAELGHVVGALSATDPEDDAVTFSLIDDAGGLFGIDGNNLIVTGVLDYETAGELGGGGGGAPEWVEDQAILGGTLPAVAISFLEDEAWADEAVGEISSVVGEDATGGLDAGWGTGTGYFPLTDLSVDGLSDADENGEVVAFIGAALTKVLSGATIVITASLIDGTWTPFMISNAAGTKFIWFPARFEPVTNHQQAFSYNLIDLEITAPFNRGAAPGALNKVAITITPTRLEFSVNGSAVESVALDTTEYENMVAAGLDLPSGLEFEDEGFVRSIAIFDPVAIGDLPTVSAL